MRRFVFCAFFFLFAFLAVAVGKVPGRVISLTPSDTEILFAVGAGNQVIGVTTADDYPPAVRKLSKVGGVDLDDEKVLSLHPDLVVGESDLVESSLSRLKTLSVHILRLHTRTLTDIPQTILQLGKATGHEQQAARLASTFRATVRNISAKARRSPFQRVFLELGDHPLLTTGSGTFLSEVIADAGGKNIADNLPKGFQIISPEEVVAANPQVIIVADDGEAATRRDILKREGWNVISAVARKRVYFINPDLIDRPGPRILQGLKKIFAWLHPQ